jgi:hypothetical protein
MRRSQKVEFTSELGVDEYRFGSAEHPCSMTYSSIEPQEVPQSFNTEKSYKTLGSLISLNGFLAVDDALKAIVKRLEPDVHQFFPIKIRMPRGKVYPTQYYIFVIGQYLDSFSPKDSDEGSWRTNGPNEYFHEKTKAGISGLAFFKDTFGRAHLWRERRMSLRPVFFSDELHTEIASAELRIPKNYRAKEVYP